MGGEAFVWIGGLSSAYLSQSWIRLGQCGTNASGSTELEFEIILIGWIGTSTSGSRSRIVSGNGIVNDLLFDLIFLLWVWDMLWLQGRVFSPPSSWFFFFCQCLSISSPRPEHSLLCLQLQGWRTDDNRWWVMYMSMFACYSHHFILNTLSTMNDCFVFSLSAELAKQLQHH